ncbi:hypothetical protein MJ560_11955 [Klebsiella pneumoniae]|nr:hypothetical protein MJ560_11955 [Klebsiella pneumoniae]
MQEGSLLLVQAGAGIVPDSWFPSRKRMRPEIKPARCCAPLPRCSITRSEIF